jgi:hypothetical protein
MKSLFSSSKKVPAVVEAVAVKETPVQEEIPVSTGQPVELVASRPGWSRTTSRITDVHANYLVLGEQQGSCETQGVLQQLAAQQYPKMAGQKQCALYRQRVLLLQLGLACWETVSRQQHLEESL